MTIDIAKLTKNDIGRNVIFHKKYGWDEVGRLTSWNSNYVFVRFNGPNGAACKPEEVSFEYDNKN